MPLVHKLGLRGTGAGHRDEVIQSPSSWMRCGRPHLQVQGFYIIIYTHVPSK